MRKVKTAAEAVALIRDGATLAVSSSSGLCCPDAVLQAIGERFAATGHPRGLTSVHPIAAGDMFGTKGVDHIAMPGLITRIIGGSYPSGPTNAEPPRIWQMILAEEVAPERTVMHCFSGDMAMARECIERGYLLSFSGTVTFKNARDLRNALSVTPMDNLLVETDAPFLTPAPHRGATNAPYLVPFTVRAMAGVLNVDVPSLCTAVAANSERVYGPW